MIDSIRNLQIMGSAKITNVKSTVQMAENTKKKPKTVIVKLFFDIFKKKDSNKKVNASDKKDSVKNEAVATPIDVLLDKLKIEDKECDDGPDDEDLNFSHKFIDDDKSERLESQLSKDSGYEEKEDVNVDEQRSADKIELDLTENLKKLQIEDKKDVKKKKIQTIFLARRPVRNKACDFRAPVHPYRTASESQDSFDPTFNQINQVNVQTLTGGQVIVNANQSHIAEVEEFFEHIGITHHSQADDDFDYKLELIQEIIDEDKSQHDVLAGFAEVEHTDEYSTDNNLIQSPIAKSPNEEEFTTSAHTDFDSFNYEMFNLSHQNTNEMIQNALCRDDLTTIIPQNKPAYLDNPSNSNQSFTYPTPPRSVPVPSPLPGVQSPFYASNSDYTLSPERSSPIFLNDAETFQDITCVVSPDNSSKETLRLQKQPSIKLKQFKEIQKEIAKTFSNKECCQTNKIPCKQVFQERLQKFSQDERANLCLNITNLDLKYVKVILHKILISLSNNSEKEDLELVIFRLICERVLSHNSSLFAGDFGLGLLELAVLRCYRLPVITRYLVECVRIALKNDTKLLDGKQTVFHEVDAQGDTLVTACARLGDAHSDALHWVVRADPGQLPLFDIHHANAEGYSALHVACKLHSISSPRLHTVHVLLEHGAADLWKGDIKGGDTGLHLAVSSSTCDLQLVMLLFQQETQQRWWDLAHAKNKSSVTPLEYARCADKSSTRQNYPREVLLFFNKCRHK